MQTRDMKILRPTQGKIIYFRVGTRYDHALLPFFKRQFFLSDSVIFSSYPPLERFFASTARVIFSEAKVKCSEKGTRK